MKRFLKSSAIFVGSIALICVLYINYPALRGRECSGLMRTRDAITLDYLRPQLLEATKDGYALAKQDHQPFLTEAEVLSAVERILDGYRSCIVERGRDRCRFIGTDPNLQFIFEGKNGPPEEEAEAYRFIIENGDLDFNYGMDTRPTEFWGEGDVFFFKFRKGRNRVSWELGVRWRRCDPKAHFW